MICKTNKQTKTTTTTKERTKRNKQIKQIRHDSTLKVNNTSTTNENKNGYK